MFEWQQFASDFHFLRPWWLLALPLGATLLWLGRKHMAMGDWAKVIDPRWLPFMVESSGDGSRSKERWPLYLWAVALACAATALAGPSWKQLPQSLHRDQSALVILLDLSPSMSAEDLKPSRIARARFKLRDILEQRDQGLTALIVYGGSAHVVTPLTDDSATIMSQLAVLGPDLMSDPGSNTEAAVEQAITMLNNNAIQSAELLLVSDGVVSAASNHIRQQLQGTGLRLSVLGVGTDRGAPIPLADGSFAKDSSGNIVIPKLDRPSLMELARQHNGLYTDLSADNSDLDRLLAHMDAPLESLKKQHKQLDRNFDSWHDQGYWLAVLLLPLALLAFRKGFIACLLLTPLLVSQPSHAEEKQPPQPAENTIANQLPDFLKTPDQRGQQAFRQEQFERAQEQFRSPQWRGSAAYRQGDYQAALEDFQQDSSATGLYNQGNALARLGKFDQAIEAYDNALKKNPALQDAAANKALLEQLKQQQQNQQGQNQPESHSGEQNSEQHSQQGNSQQESQEKSQQDSQQNSQQESKQNSPQKSPQSSTQKSEPGESSEQQDSQQQQSDQAQQQNPQQEDGDGEEQSQPSKPTEQQASKNEQQASQSASQQNSDEEAERAMEQFLRKVPDDPGAFLREKFRRQQQRQKRQPQPERL